jgi:beta-lactamase regulating signal transducer with metallopeptidase domain
MDWLSLNNIARELLAWMADASVRAVLLAALALLLIPFVRHSSTAQHMAWILVLAGMLLAPLLRPVIPAAHVRVPRMLAPRPVESGSVHRSAKATPVSAPMPVREAKNPPPVSPFWPLYAVAVYLAGVMFFGTRVLGGVLLTRRALRNTRTIHSELWQHYELIADADVDLNLEESDSVQVPLTTGSSLTRVILPADWRAWPAEKRTAVLAHELAHAGRRDPLIALLVAVNKCLFWFHPLAWWLERRLPVMAEHAADDAALAVIFDPQAYARVLLDIASRSQGAGHRVVWNAAAMSGPVVAQRIRRVLRVRTPERIKPMGVIGRAVLLSLGAMLIWISTAVDVPKLVAGQTNPSGNHFPWQINAEQAAVLEQELAANPENETIRKKLLTYYGFADMCAVGLRLGLHTPSECSDRIAETADRKIPLILWLIDHHPESDLLKAPLISPQFDGPNVYQDVRNHWLAQVNLHPNDARVLVNAAGAIGGRQEKIDLLQRARKLDPARATEPLASFGKSAMAEVYLCRDLLARAKSSGF